MTVADTVIKYKLERGLSLRDMAAAISEAGVPITYGAIYCWTAGQNKPSRSLLLLMQRLFNADDWRHALASDLLKVI